MAQQCYSKDFRCEKGFFDLKEKLNVKDFNNVGDL